ncbi:hypothetical protein SAMN05444354_108261 [Stigmatella aurantiaca]|uniref:Lipoprotein n=1 Tax=Stigmatella aurantiaca TaxID=41 RepID=A0A1H7T4N4_STIAU|nr:hypothetical protein [Stigmatella aurantiaca]SEL79459.1 hypothetical protein SAMN05444354_108261 [Stigmatella aurantiaca]
MSAPRILFLGLCAALAGCAAKKPPPAKQATLGSSKLEYRDYALVRGSICGMGERPLAAELTTLTQALEQFAASTDEAAKPEATPTEEQLTTLREGAQALGPVADTHRKNLAVVRECKFSRNAPYPELIQKGTAAVDRAKARMKEAPAILAAAGQRASEAKWQEESTARETTAKQTWCTAKTAVGSGDLYFARQDKEGTTRWLFCDGITVEAASGAEPTLAIPDTIKARERKRIQASRYLEAAKSYPAEEIDKPGAAKSTAAEQ